MAVEEQSDQREVMPPIKAIPPPVSKQLVARYHRILEPIATQAWQIAADTVVLPPKLTALPLMVMLLFVRLLLPMLDSVLLLPLMVLLVRV